MNKEAVVIGYSGHSYVILDILLNNGYKIIGYCEKEPKAKNPYSLNYLGPENDSEVLKILKNHSAFIAIGDNKIRESIFSRLMQEKVKCPALIHSQSIISKQVLICEGTVIMPGVIINSQSKIGKAVICNSSAIIEHECHVGDYAHIAPGAVLAGNVSIGNNSFIGANSVIKQGIKVGANVIVGAGSVVVKDISDGLTVYGNPARVRQ
jgi:sugar O-acyltransferase (sialic acid O-acetyltransferase NeuD family)